MKYNNIREEELKNKVAADWFVNFDTTAILGNRDFTVFPKQANLFGRLPLLWAEAKTGDFAITTMFVQLVLTIGKARTFDKTLPPAFLGAFDFKKIAFVPYISIQDIFYLNDFNWNVTPSNHDTKEFQLIKNRIQATLKDNTYIYDYVQDQKELQFFITNNIAKASQSSKIKIDKNNFIPIYLRWLEVVKPIIKGDWSAYKKINILDSDFYLADLFVDDKDTHKIDDDVTIRQNLLVVFQNEAYKIAKEDLVNQMFDATISITNKELYLQFWKSYKRPPLQQFQEYIIQRRDLLVPQDIRERKGAFFTPFKWVELSQKYVADALGPNWQDEYYIWDCAAGTGNLLAGLANKYNIWASTLDQADVNVMQDRIEHGANLLHSHVFQFDFLNDDFSKLPKGLQEIINDETKRQKLLVYINPPYAEASDRATVVSQGENKTKVATEHKFYTEFTNLAGTAARELFTQFFIRIYKEIPDAKLATFSTLKYINSQNFQKFRSYFKVDFLNGFVCPANTFDNVAGKFPIGFLIWDLKNKKNISNILCSVYNADAIYHQEKSFFSVEKNRYVINWLRNFYDKKNDRIAYLRMQGTDMQNNQGVFFTQNPSSNDLVKHLLTDITVNNIIQMSIYLAIRHAIEATWLNDRDQFLYPNNGWESDVEFQHNCLAFALFHSQNKISCSKATNHWIPFTEQQVNAKEKFDSNFMTDYINGKWKAGIANENELFKQIESTNIYKPKVFSAEATAVFEAGKKLWYYYHQQNEVLVNASYYDIRAHFQGRNEKGRMNAKSNDAVYTELIENLRSKQSILAKAIQPKIYEYGFLKM
jgi:hypothetical protein